MKINYEMLYDLLKTDRQSGKENFLGIKVALLEKGIINVVTDDVVVAAMAIAHHFHRNQVDKSGYPYFAHCLSVAKHFIENQDSFGLIAAAILHDVVEDTQVSAEDLNVIFGSKIGNTVGEVTRYKGEPYDDFIGQIKSEWAVKIKIQDLLQNMNLLRLRRITAKDLARTQKYTNALLVLSARLSGLQECESF